VCAILGVAEAIRGIASVLRPGGQLLFFEHGLSPDVRVRRQERTEPFFHWAFEGCHVTRDIPEGSESNGWRQGTSLDFQNPDRITFGASRISRRADISVVSVFVRTSRRLSSVAEILQILAAREGPEKRRGAGLKASAPGKLQHQMTLLLIAGARGHRALDHLFGSHGRHGHGLEEWPANGNHVPRLQ
jgi:hypothetical protein